MSTSRKADHIPPEGTKSYKLLSKLLRGDRVDPFTALMELNLPTVNARASELRAMGWPVMSKREPHPKLTDETIVVFYFDTHFRLWVVANPDKHPNEYPSREGRGKFSGRPPAPL